MGSRTKSISSLHPKPLQDALSDAISFQQEMYELSADWNYYEATEHEHLKKNIKYAIFGAPSEDSGNLKPSDSKEDTQTNRTSPEEQDEITESLYKKIVESSRTKNSLHVGTIFNVICSLGKENEKQVAPIPIFKVKRCEEKGERSTSTLGVENTGEKKKKLGRTALHSYCVCYIDVEGRIYKNWTDYVTNNTLPKCTMVLPMGGFYQPDPSAPISSEESHVWIEVGPSPTANRILPVLDVAGTVLGVGALGVGIAAALATAPIAAPIAMAGTVCGVVSGVYTTTRSGHQLVDRHKHQQSIKVTDKTARSAWFSVVGGLAGGLASSSTLILNKAVQAGVNVGNVGTRTYNAIAIGNIVVNGLGIGNGVYGIYKNYSDNKEYSVLEIGQLVAHILFFGNAVMNFQTARTIIDNTQQKVIQEYESSLRSNRHRKAFRRIRRNTEASNGDRTIGDSEIIRGIRSIENKNDFFAGVVRNRKIFNSSKAEVTFKDGYAMINDNVKFDPVELSQQPIEVRGNTVSAAQPFDNKFIKNGLLQTTKMTISAYNEQVQVASNIIESIGKFASTVITIDKLRHVGKLVLDMQGLPQNNRDNLITKLAKLGLHIVQKHRQFIIKSLAELMDYIWFRYVRPRVDTHLQEMNIDASNMSLSPDIVEIVYDITRTVIDKMYDCLEEFLQEIIENCSNHTPATESSTCSVCSGYVLGDT